MRKINFIYALAALALVANSSCTKDDPIPEPTPSAIVGLVINEVHPSGSPGDWVELFNSSSSAIDLSGFNMYDGNGPVEGYIFPEGTSLAAGAYLVLEKETHFTYGLNEADEVNIIDKNEAVVAKTTLNPTLAGFVDGETSWARQSNGEYTWGASTKGKANNSTPDDNGGNEGEVVQPSNLKGIIFINEINADGQPEDWVELYNASDSVISLASLKIHDAKGSEDPGAGILDADLVIEANSYFVLHGEVHFTFGISKTDDVISLLDATGNEIDKIEMATYSNGVSVEEGKTIGRLTDGGEEIAILNWETKGTTNVQTEISSIRGTLFINEIDPDGTPEDKIELYNAGTSDINLNGFRLFDGGGIADDDVTTFGDVIVPAGGYLVLEGAVDFMFGISKKDDVITIVDAEGKFVDCLDMTNIVPEGVSIEGGLTVGRKEDGLYDLVIFTQASLGATNNGNAIQL